MASVQKAKADRLRKMYKVETTAETDAGQGQHYLGGGGGAIVCEDPMDASLAATPGAVMTPTAPPPAWSEFEPQFVDNHEMPEASVPPAAFDPSAVSTHQLASAPTGMFDKVAKRAAMQEDHAAETDKLKAQMQKQATESAQKAAEQARLAQAQRLKL